MFIHPYFSLIRDRLYRVNQDSQGKKLQSCWSQRALGKCSSRQLSLTQWPVTSDTIKHNSREWPTPITGSLGRYKKVVHRVSQVPIGQPSGYAKRAIKAAPTRRGAVQKTQYVPHQVVRPRCSQVSFCSQVLVDYVTQYLKAVPLCRITAKNVTQALFQVLLESGFLRKS